MKKLILSSATLKKELALLGVAVMSNHIVPALQNVLCRVDKTQLELTTSNSELTITRKIEVECKDTFEILLPFDHLKDLMGKIPDSPITIEHPSTRKARIICDDDEFDISLAKFDEYPTVPPVPKKNVLPLPDTFIGLLEKAMMTIGSDHNRPELMKACLDLGTEGSTLISCDSNFFYTHKVELQSATPEKLLFVKAMTSALKGMTGVQLSWTAKHICISNGSTSVWALRHEDKYPDVIKVMPVNEANFEMSQAVLVDGLRKACLNSNPMKQTQIHLKKEEGIIHFDYEDSDMGRKGHLKKPGTYTGPIETVSVNAGKLLTLMSQVETDKIKLHIHGIDKPVVITTEENPNYRGMIALLKFNK